jgi:uncharacterized protein YqjF (DUF2071 family)
MARRSTAESLEDRILQDDEHRPWPVPDRPWVMRQTWHDLLFVHWPMARDRLREIVPTFLDIDTFENEAWVGITPFRLSAVTARGIPALPWVSSFNEINVRTYVVYDGIPGVYFFSLDADSTLAVGGARTLFHLPYYLAEIEFERDGQQLSFTSRRLTPDNAQFRSTHTPDGKVFQPAVNTLEHWLTERYCLYTTDSAAKAYRVEIHHRPWSLQTAEGRFDLNTMAEAAGIRLPSMAPLLHFSRRLDVLNWSPEELR